VTTCVARCVCCGATRVSPYLVARRAAPPPPPLMSQYKRMQPAAAAAGVKKLADKCNYVTTVNRLGINVTTKSRIIAFFEENQLLRSHLRDSDSPFLLGAQRRTLTHYTILCTEAQLLVGKILENSLMAFLEEDYFLFLSRQTIVRTLPSLSFIYGPLAGKALREGCCRKRFSTHTWNI
jgi:hypothetical protein